MSNKYAYLKKFQAQRKNDIVYTMGEECKICGYNKCNAALELHHIDPNEKEFSFSDNVNLAWEKVKQELQKCILVCANCHREIHQGLIEQQLQSSYIQERADEISQRISDITHHKISYCKYCGKIVYKNSNCCVECAAKERRVVERPTREELKKLIRECSFVEIGKRFKVTDNAIRKWCDNYNLPRKKKDINNYSDEEWLYI